MSSATNEQITWIEQFLTARSLYFGDFDRLWAQLEAHRIDERCKGDGTPIGLARADAIIGWLNRWEAHRTQARNFAGPVGCRHAADRNGNCIT